MRRTLLAVGVVCLLATTSGGAHAQQTSGTDPLANPELAVYRALQARGINPAYDRRPMVQNTLARAEEIVYMVVLNRPEVLLDPDVFRQAIEDLVGAAGRGGTVLGGWGVNDLRGLVERARNADRLTDPAGWALAVYLDDDTFSGGLARAGLGGGRSERERSVIAQLVTFGCMDYRQIVRVERPGVFDNCLHYLVTETLRGW
jgi:hypothetical protein